MAESKPWRSATSGRTRCPSSSTSAISPSASRSAKAGTGTTAGRPRQRASVGREFGVGDRLRRDGVDRAADIVVRQREQHQLDQVVAMDPAHPLLARPDAAAEPGAKHRQHARERAAVALEHDTDAEHDGAHAERLRRDGLAFPRSADFGEEVAAGRRAFADQPRRRYRRSSRRPTRTAARAAVARPAARRASPPGSASRSTRESPNQRLALRGPAPVGDAGARPGSPPHRRRRGRRARSTRLGIPGRDAAPRRQHASRRARDRDVSATTAWPASEQTRSELPPDEPRRAGDRDPHVLLMAAAG